jgi:hypothetical protein
VRQRPIQGSTVRAGLSAGNDGDSAAGVLEYWVFFIASRSPGAWKASKEKTGVKREYLDQLAAWFKEEVKGFFSMGQWQNDGTDSMLEDFL